MGIEQTGCKRAGDEGKAARPPSPALDLTSCLDCYQPYLLVHAAFTSGRYEEAYSAYEDAAVHGIADAGLLCNKSLAAFKLGAWRRLRIVCTCQ
jgi:hypothetical protein